MIAEAAGIVVLVVGGIALVGWLLPKQHTASTSGVFAAPPEAVWQLLVDVKGQVKWRKGVKVRDVSTDAATRKNAAVGDARGRSAAQGAPSGGAPQGEPSESADHAPLPPAQWVELRGNLRVPLRVVEAVPLVKLVTHTYDEPGRKPLYFGAQWSFTLEPVEVEGMAGHATRVTLVEDGYVTSPTLRFLYGVLMGYATTCERFVTDLGSIVPELDEDEHGQAVLSAEAKARIAEAQRRREAARKREADVNALLAATPGIEATATPSATGAQAAPRGWPRAASRTAPTLRHRRLRAEP